MLRTALGSRAGGGAGDGTALRFRLPLRPPAPRSFCPFPACLDHFAEILLRVFFKRRGAGGGWRLAALAAALLLALAERGLGGCGRLRAAERLSGGEEPSPFPRVRLGV